MEYPEKEVRFDNYCKICLHKNTPEETEPCRTCLTVSHNTHSHKPISFIEDSREKTTP